MPKTKSKTTLITFPTVLTIMRIILVAPLMLCLFSDALPAKICALICFVVAAITDFVDGRLARKYHQVTDLGAFLDPLADKMLVNLTFFALCMTGILHPAIFGVILIRDFAVDGMRMMVAKTGVTVSASIFGKAKTMTQMLMLTFALIRNLLTIPTPFLDNLIAVLTAAMLILTIYSGCDYLIKGWQLLKAAPRQ